MTLRSPAPTMQPESSDGFASVGTILPRKELPSCRAALSVSAGKSRSALDERQGFALPDSRDASLTGSDQVYPQDSQSQLLEGSTDSSVGSAARHLGQVGIS